MQTFNKIKVSSKSADITILDDGSDTELYGSCRVNNGVLEAEIVDDSIIVIPAAHYEDIEVNASAGDCCVRLTRSTVDHISVESITGDIEVEADTDNVSMASCAGSCVKKGRLHTDCHSSIKTKKSKVSRDDVSVSSSDVSILLKGDKN